MIIRRQRLGIGLGLCLLAATPAGAQGVNGAINAPAANGTAMQPFAVTGWAIHGPGAGTGIDIIRVSGCLSPCAGPLTLWGTATYGLARPDVAAAYGAQYLNSGYTFTKAGLTPGTYYLKVETHSTVNGAWYIYGHWITVQAGPEHTLELPAQSAALTSPVAVKGWAIDAGAPSGTGVNTINLWTHPNPGSGQVPLLLGTATYGANRADIAASHGERFRYSGYTASLASLPAGANYLGAAAHSPHNNTWTYRWKTIYVDTPTVPLTIDRPGTGTGGVTGSGLSCPGGSMTQAVPCGASYPLHTVVTLTAAPDPGSTFSGWGGACTGSGTCQVTLATAKFVTASFAKTPNSIATRYYHTDVVGSVRAITDETGAVVLRHDYRPFGEDTQPLAGDPNRFAGKQLDAETAMHYFDARYYRQTWGRFSTVDPLMVGAAMTDPQQWNRYTYAKNNPLAWGDPTGLQGVPTFRSGVDVCANGGIPPLCAMGSGGAGGAPGMTSGNATPPSGTCEGLNGYGDFYLWVPCAGDDTVGQGSSAAWVSVCAMYPSLPKCQTAPPDTGGTPDGGDPGGDNDDDELPECDGPFCEIARDIDKRIGAAAHLTTWLDFYLLSASGNRWVAAAVCAFRGCSAGDAFLAVTPLGRLNKMKHIFGNPAHRLGPLIRTAGSEGAAFDAVIAAANGHARQLPSGVHTFAVDVLGHAVTVRGNVTTSGFQLGSAWIP